MVDLSPFVPSELGPFEVLYSCMMNKDDRDSTSLARMSDMLAAFKTVRVSLCTSVCVRG